MQKIEQKLLVEYDGDNGKRKKKLLGYSVTYRFSFWSVRHWRRWDQPKNWMKFTSKIFFIYLLECAIPLKWNLQVKLHRLWTEIILGIRKERKNDFRSWSRSETDYGFCPVSTPKSIVYFVPYPTPSSPKVTNMNWKPPGNTHFYGEYHGPLPSEIS